MDRFMTISEVADNPRISDKTVRNMIKAGLFEITRVGAEGGKILIAREELERYITAASKQEVASSGQ